MLEIASEIIIIAAIKYTSYTHTHTHTHTQTYTQYCISLNTFQVQCIDQHVGTIRGREQKQGQVHLISQHYIHAMYMYSTYTIHAMYMYSTCIIHAMYMHSTCIIHAPVFSLCHFRWLLCPFNNTSLLDKTTPNCKILEH